MSHDTANRDIDRVFISLLDHEPVGGYTTKSVTHDQCDVRPTVTFPATEHNHSLVGIKVYCLAIEAHKCK